MIKPNTFSIRINSSENNHFFFCENVCVTIDNFSSGHTIVEIRAKYRTVNHIFNLKGLSFLKFCETKTHKYTILTVLCLSLVSSLRRGRLLW